MGKCLRWAEELLLADPLVDEQRRNLSAFVPAFAEDESRYERGERVMLEMMDRDA